MIYRADKTVLSDKERWFPTEGTHRSLKMIVANGRGIVTKLGWQFFRNWLLSRIFIWWRIRDGIFWILAECLPFLPMEDRPLWTVSRFDWSPGSDVHIVIKTTCSNDMPRFWILMEILKLLFMVVKIKPWKQIYLKKFTS